jgi:p-hydroxybenzoate 3-monooxygenase
VPVTWMPDKPGIAIVGAGPAGLVIAHLLQREAIPFVVFERQELADLCRRPKAGLIEYRTVQLLQREAIAGPILQFTAENHRCEFRTPEESAVLDYGALTGGRPHYIYPQHQLVQRLCETLTGAGGEIRFGMPSARSGRIPAKSHCQLTDRTVAGRRSGARPRSVARDPRAR